MVWSGRTLVLLSLAAAALCVPGWLLGLPELSALAVAGWLALCASAAWLARWHSVPEVALSAHPRAVGRDEPAALRVRVRNTTGTVTAAVRLHGRLATAGEGILAVTALRPHESTEVEVILPTPARGVLTAGPLWATTVDPLGWWRRTVTIDTTATVLVRPRVHALPTAPRGAGPVRAPRGARGLGQGGSVDDELVGLRQYVRGDDLRLIHWRTSARRNYPHVVQVEPPAQAPAVALLLDTSGGTRDIDAFERAVEAAASVLHRTATDGHPVRLLTAHGWDSGRTAASSSGALIDLLARVDLRPGGDLRRALDDALQDDDGAVVLCTGDAAALSVDSPVDRVLGAASGDSLTVVTTAAVPWGGAADSDTEHIVHWDGTIPLAQAWSGRRAPSGANPRTTA